MNGDWTIKNGVSNSSDKYEELCLVVERLIRGDAHFIMNGRADLTARIIVSTLAFRHGLTPTTEGAVQ